MLSSTRMNPMPMHAGAARTVAHAGKKKRSWAFPLICCLAGVLALSPSLFAQPLSNSQKPGHGHEQTLIKELKSGMRNPTTLEEAVIAFDAQNGINLASAPKLRPDNKLYYMSGHIEQAEGSSLMFLARSSRGAENDLIAKALGAPSVSTNYYAVEIPERLEEFFFSNAQIGVGFDMVGKYTWNTSYTTVAGQEKSMPGFEVEYFAFWHVGAAASEQPVSPASQDNAVVENQSHAVEETVVSDEYSRCTAAALSAVESSACSTAELKRQDARLNAAYKAAMGVVKDPQTLRLSQRQWIKERDRQCNINNFEDLGRGAPLTQILCTANVTAERAAVLEQTR